MADRKLDLTRRKALLSMGTIGVAGATGAGAWARFTDRERKIFQVEAGHLDLKFKTKKKYKKDGKWKYRWVEHNGPVTISYDNVKNHDTIKHCEWLINRGSVPGDKLCVKLKDVIDKEHDLLTKAYDYGPDGEDPGDDLEKSKVKKKYRDDLGKYYLDESPNRGELSKFISVIGFLWCPDGDKWRCKRVRLADGTVEDTGITADDPMTHTFDSSPFELFAAKKLRDLEGKKVCVKKTLEPGDKCLFCVFARISEKFTKFEDANIAMTDETKAIVDFELIQKEGDKVKGDVDIGNGGSNS